MHLQRTRGKEPRLLLLPGRHSETIPGGHKGSIPTCRRMTVTADGTAQASLRKRKGHQQTGHSTLTCRQMTAIPDGTARARSENRKGRQQTGHSTQMLKPKERTTLRTRQSLPENHSSPILPPNREPRGIRGGTLNLPAGILPRLQPNRLSLWGRSSATMEGKPRPFRNR